MELICRITVLDSIFKPNKYNHCVLLIFPPFLQPHGPLATNHCIGQPSGSDAYGMDSVYLISFVLLFK
jgi:hypothetical protein